MPIDIDSSLTAIGRGLEHLPRAILAPLLLAGPTLLWLLYRFHVKPGPAARAQQSIDVTAWVCGACNSLTPVEQASCYRCHAERPARLVELERDEADPDGVGIAVGPGR